ncbi:MAG: hypothetical protein HKN33_14370 [Pyrinomonadaceae bacterium]|nr:hypothetical protein [Pyrinomonadaceae bacterium]
MKNLIYLFAVALLSACAGSAPEVAEKPVTNTKDQSKRVSETVASHTLERKKDAKPVDNTNSGPAETVPKPSKTKRKWSRSGDPIDTTKLDAAVKSAGADKKALGKAYFERGVALTSARQYAAAIGDFRKAIKNDPSLVDAKKQIAVITSIYNSMNIEVPGEGEEPAPLEFNK